MSVAPEKTKQEKKKTEKKKKPLGQEISSWVLTFLAALVLLGAVNAFFFQVIRVKGHSMDNTLQNGDMVWVSKQVPAYQRGDVVICRYPNRTEHAWNLGASLTFTVHTVFVKRLVALPGDSVEIREGKLYVNDTLVPDPPAMGSTPRDYARRTLGKNEYFVVGDNRFSSHDSRADDVGPISADMLQGKAQYVIWPLGSIRRIE